MAVRREGSHYTGLSTDTKPTDTGTSSATAVLINDSFTETDTDDEYRFNGAGWDLRVDNNALRVTLLGSEDTVNSVLKTEQRFSFNNIVSATTTVVKSGAGLLHSINVNKAVVSGVITIYDNTAGSGTKIGTITFGVALLTDPPLLGLYDVSFATGLTIVTSAATDITVSYR